MTKQAGSRPAVRVARAADTGSPFSFRHRLGPAGSALSLAPAFATPRSRDGYVISVLSSILPSVLGLRRPLSLLVLGLLSIGGLLLLSVTGLAIIGLGLLVILSLATLLIIAGCGPPS